MAVHKHLMEFSGTIYLPTGANSPEASRVSLLHSLSFCPSICLLAHLPCSLSLTLVNDGSLVLSMAQFALKLEGQTKVIGS